MEHTKGIKPNSEDIEKMVALREFVQKNFYSLPSAISKEMIENGLIDIKSPKEDDFLEIMNDIKRNPYFVTPSYDGQDIEILKFYDNHEDNKTNGNSIELVAISYRLLRESTYSTYSLYYDEFRNVSIRSYKSFCEYYKATENFIFDNIARKYLETSNVFKDINGMFYKS